MKLDCGRNHEYDKRGIAWILLTVAIVAVDFFVPGIDTITTVLLVLIAAYLFITDFIYE